MKQVQELITNKLKGHEKLNLLEQITVLSKEFATMVEAHDRLDNCFTDLGMDHIWIECPDCKSPVLLNSINCPYCEANLVGDDVLTTAAPTEEAKPCKTSKKKAKKKVAKKAKAEEEVEEEEVEEEAGSIISAETIRAEEAENEEDAFPSVDEINKMRVPGLKVVIEENELDIDPADHPKTKDLREAVNEAIDALSGSESEEGEEVSEEEEEGEAEEVSEEATEDEVDEFNLDDFEDDDDGKDDADFDD